MKASALAERSRPAERARLDGDPALLAPAAVRIVDLDVRLTEVRLPRTHVGERYRSLLLVARLDGEPLGTAALSVAPSGRVSRGRVARELRSQLEAELRDALGRRGLALPDSLPLTGIPTIASRNGGGPTRHRYVSVVVTTCRNPVALERCLRSIVACDYDEFEVIVVENRPESSATRTMLAERFRDEVRIRYVEEPWPGLSRARNAGLAFAKGDVVAFTDDDVVVDPAWIRRCADAFDSADDVACVTGLILPLELETDTQLLFEQFAGFGKGFRPRVFRLPDSRQDHPLLPYTPGLIGSGANTVVRADVLRQLGGFEITLGTGTPALGAEDLELFIRLLRAGHAVAYEPGAIVRHQHPDGITPLRRQVYRYGIGLGALLTQQLLAAPNRSELLRTVPGGVRHLRDPASHKNVGKTAAYPRYLDWLERLGMLVGPVAYLASVLAAVRGRLPQLSRATAGAGHILYVERLILSGGEPIEVVSFTDRKVAWPTTAGPRQVAAAQRRGSRRALVSPTHRAMVATATASCVAAPLLVALGAPAALRFLAVLALLCLAPGMAVLAALRSRVEPGLVLGVSLAASVVVAQSMLWLNAWWPKAFLYALAGACLPPLVSQLGTGIRPARSETLTLAGFSLGDSPSRAEPRWGFAPPARLSPVALRNALRSIPASVAGHGAVLTVALAAWAASLVGAELDRMAGIGLLNAMPPTYFIAFGLLVVGFAAAVTRDELSPRLLGLYVLALILVVHGTTPLLYDEPRYAWVYKHLAVIDFIAQSGGVDRHVDAYNNWPGFFAINAWLTEVSGLGPAAYAAWAQVFFNLANVAALRFALRGLTNDERLLWTASWLFLLGNWVGQDYLAPQAFAFPLSLVVLGLCLRCGRASRAPRWRAGRRLVARLDQLRMVLLRRRALDEPLLPAPLSPRAAVFVGGLCYLAVVVSHQLTPVMLLAGVTGLALFTRRVPLWVPAAMAIVEIWWLALAWSYFGAHYDLLSFDPTASAAPAGYRPGEGLPGISLVGYGARAEFVLMAALAVVGLLRRARAGRWDLAAVILVVAPVLVVGLQSYGGEGRYRVSLFTLPWLCFFAAAGCAPVSRARLFQALRGSRLFQALRGWRLALASGALGVCLLFAYLGQELSNRVTHEDVAAGVWFNQHAPQGSLVVQITPNAILRVTARYARVYDPVFSGSPALTDEAAFRDRRLGRKDLPRLETTLREYGARHTFLMLTGSQERFARLYGILPAGWQHSFEAALRSSPSFRLIYRRGASLIFKYKPTT